MMKTFFLSCFIGCFLFFGQIFAQETKTLNVSGLQKPVTIIRDGRAIPYIEAQNEADLYFAQGYVTASDRLWQMDVYRRVSHGELSEIFGKQVLEEDKKWRRYGFLEIVQKSESLISPELKTALANYTRGVNAYISSLNEQNLPIEFKLLQYKPRPWKTTDTLMIGKILADALSSTWQNDLIRASLKSLPKEKFEDITRNVTKYDVILFGKDSTAKTTAWENNFPARDYTAFIERENEIRRNSLERIGFYAEELAASNNWVISGKRTQDGKAILANDPHLQASAPGIWYLTHLSAGNMRVSGVTFPGVPGITLGHNENIAWGATNVGPDVQDLYVEEFNDQKQYKTPTGWENVKVRREEIKVRKNPLSPETESVIYEVEETRNGVVITDEVGQKFALKWTARQPENQEWEAFYFLNRAKNWEDFRNALKKYGGAAQNFIYADTKGNIGWQVASKIPIRRKGEGELPYQGSTSDGDWISVIPFNELPFLYNPPEGFIVTANQRIVGTEYKYQFLSRDAATPARVRRIYDLINANPKMTLNDSRDIQYDAFSLPLSILAREIVKTESASPESLAVLRGWDGKMNADSKGALLSNEIRNVIAMRIAEENKPAPWWLIRERVVGQFLEEQKLNWLPKKFGTINEFLKECDKTARENLNKRFGNDESKWIWGNQFKANFPHPLAVAPLIGAQFATPNVGINGSGTSPNVGSSVSMRHLTSPGNWDETKHGIPLGQSGDPKSPFWKDQFESWRIGSPQVFPFTKEAIKKVQKETIVLQPKN